MAAVFRRCYLLRNKSRNNDKYILFCYVYNMLKLADALGEIVAGNPLLQFGLQHRLLNLSKTASYLCPLIAVKTKKDVQESTVHMALSRLQRSSRKKGLHREEYEFKQITMQTGLSTYTFTRTEAAHAGVHKLYDEVQRRNGYMTISQGAHQITIIIESGYAASVKKHVTQRPRFIHENVSSVGITFDEKYLQIPGLIYIVMQQLMLLNINIIEVSSTCTELVVYIDDADIQSAFEALHYLFVK